MIDAYELESIYQMAQIDYQRNLVTCPGLVEDSVVQLTQPGVYFNSFSVGVSSNLMLQSCAVDDRNITYGNIIRSSTHHQASETLSKTFLMHINQADTLRAAGIGYVFDTSTYLMTSWSGYRMNSVLNLQEAFSVERTSPLSQPGPVSFDRHLVVVGGGLGPDGGHFTVTTPGIYLFSLSIGITDDSNSTQVSLRVNDQTELLLHRSDIVLDGLDTLSQTALLQLSSGDVVGVNLDHGHLENSEEDAVTSFTGFQYEPSINLRVAWFSYRTEPWQASHGPSFNPITFDSVSINEGDAYNTSSHTVVLPYSGVYFVHVSVGVVTERKMWIQIRHNGVNIGSVARLDDQQPWEDVVSRGVMFEGEEGDTVHLWADACPTCALFSTPTGKETTFMGMLVSPRLGGDTV